MKKISEMPKIRLAIFSLMSGMGLSLLIWQIISEFVYPHNPDESLITRIIFLIVCQIPTIVAVWGMIATAIEVKKSKSTSLVP